MTGMIQSLKSPRRIALLSLAALVVIALIVTILRFNKRIDAEREQSAAATRVEVQESVLRPPSTDGITTYLNSADVRATVLFNNLRYLATSGGLIALDENGNVKKRYTTLDGSGRPLATQAIACQTLLRTVRAGLEEHEEQYYD